VPVAFNIGADFIGDARAYSVGGQYIAEIITNKLMPTIDGTEPKWLSMLRDEFKGTIPAGAYRVDSFTNYIGFIYSAFGYAPITVKFINSSLSVFTAVLIFFFVKDRFSDKAANIALLLCLFWPSLLMWSVTGLKESLSIFLITVSVYIFLKLKNYMNIIEASLLLTILTVTNYTVGISLFIGILIIRIFKKFTIFLLKRQNSVKIITPLILMVLLKISLDSLKLVRIHVFFPLLIALIISAIVFLNKKNLIAFTFILICAGYIWALYAPNQMTVINENFIKCKKYINNDYHARLIKAIDVQRSQLGGAKSGYKIYPERFYDNTIQTNKYKLTTQEFMISYVKGFVYSLFLPFPWTANSGSQLICSLQLVIFYILFLFIILGILMYLRCDWREALPIVMGVFTLMSLFALHEGNSGTVFRHRDMVMPFLLAFGGIGIYKFINHLNKLKQSY
jgi:hypothetical protein